MATTGQSVNNYASTKLCCIATNVIEADYVRCFISNS